MSNARNSQTTHPRKAARRASAMERFTVARKRMDDAAYMARKTAEWLALGGTSESFKFCAQKLTA